MVENSRIPLLQGSLLESGDWPITLSVRFGDLGRAFLPKGRAGRGYRAVARNGRVLLASDRPAAELAGGTACVRLQTWHRRILPGDPPTVHGILLHVRSEAPLEAVPRYDAVLIRAGEGPFALALDVGGLRMLEFRPR